MVSIDKLQELNKWWTKGAQFPFDDSDLMKYNQMPVKIAHADLVSRLRAGSIVVVKGPRRVGKTILAKNAILKLLRENAANADDILYFSFDSVVSAREMDNMLRNFLAKPHTGTVYIFLDEIQAVSGWADVLLGLSNSGLLSEAAVLLTGSIAHLMKTETLPGRGTEGNTYFLRTASFRTFVRSVLMLLQENPTYLNYVMDYRFTHGEIANFLKDIEGTIAGPDDEISAIRDAAVRMQRYFRPLSKMFEIYLLTGGYPASINDAIIRARANNTYEEIYNYAKSDAATLAMSSTGDPQKAGQVLSGVVDYVGNKVSYSKIARNLSMNKKTMISYYSRLENSFVFISINGVKPLEGKLVESEVKKIYFSDVFTHYAVGAVQTGKQGLEYSKELINSSKVGAVVEEIVAGHLIRVKELDPMRPYKTYLRFYDGRKELDFIYKGVGAAGKEELVGIEVKYQTEISQGDLNPVEGISKYILLTKTADVERKDRSVSIPVCVFLAMLRSSDNDL